MHAICDFFKRMKGTLFANAFCTRTVVKCCHCLFRVESVSVKCSVFRSELASCVHVLYLVVLPSMLPRCITRRVLKVVVVVVVVVVVDATAGACG